MVLLTTLVGWSVALPNRATAAPLRADTIAKAGCYLANASPPIRVFTLDGKGVHVVASAQAWCDHARAFKLRISVTRGRGTPEGSTWSLNARANEHLGRNYEYSCPNPGDTRMLVTTAELLDANGIVIATLTSKPMATDCKFYRNVR
jgi:hypothetical protein